MSEGEVTIGGNGRGNQASQLNLTVGILFDGDANLYFVEGWNHLKQ
jgi:hypothetical protein